jgi:hypothetical protein
MIMLTEARMLKYEERLLEIVNSYVEILRLCFYKDMAYPTRLVLLHS